jgi:sugar/nucleoside kinase (ribokinase family)
VNAAQCCSMITVASSPPAYPLENEVDPTGAGDTFAGALLGYLANVGELDAGAFRRALMMAWLRRLVLRGGVGTRAPRSSTSTRSRSAWKSSAAWFSSAEPPQAACARLERAVAGALELGASARASRAS